VRREQRRLQTQQPHVPENVSEHTLGKGLFVQLELDQPADTEIPFPTLRQP
jgi:hypothetical protein